MTDIPGLETTAEARLAEAEQALRAIHSASFMSDTTSWPEALALVEAYLKPILDRERAFLNKEIGRD